MGKVITYGIDARNKIFEGIKEVSKAVKATMGPKGKNIILDQGRGFPLIVNDGVTVARNISFDDYYKNLGAQMVRQAAGNTNFEAGDGTTTATVLLEAIVEEGLKKVSSGISAFKLSRGMHKAKDDVIEFLKQEAVQIESNEQLESIASISAQDKDVGAMIANLANEVGPTGIITVEEWDGDGIKTDVVQGLRVRGGYMSQYFAKDNSKKVELENVSILVTDLDIRSVRNLQKLGKLLEQEQFENVLIICENMSDNILKILVSNYVKGHANIVAMDAPEFGENRRKSLNDICAVTGATILAADNTQGGVAAATKAHFGRADKVVVGKNETLFTGGQGNPEKLAAYIAALQAEAKSDETSAYNKQLATERVAKLSGGIAVIKVGAASDMEKKNKKLKIEDALNAVKSALEEGVLPGAGTSLVKAQAALQGESKNTDFAIGYEIVLKALSAPLHQIATNAEEEAALIVSEVRKNTVFEAGYNIETMEQGDLIEMGVIDPVKVERVALESAVSTAVMLLTSAAVVADEEMPEGVAQR